MRFVGLWTLLCWAVACGDDDDGGAPDAAALPDAPVAEPDAPPAPDAEPAADARPPNWGATCETPLELGEGVAVMDSSTMAVNYHVASCSGGSSAAPERYFRFDAGESPVDVLIDVTVDESAMPPFDAVVSARTTCDAATELACIDAGRGERLELLGVTGAVLILVDGTTQYGGLAQGDFTITATRRAISGMGATCDPAGVLSRCDADLRCDAGTCVPTSAALACTEAIDLTADLADGAAETTGTLLAADPGYYEGSCAFVPGAGAERLYRFTLPAPATVVASTEGVETTFDTVLYLRDECDGADLACDDDVAPEAMEYRSRLEAPLAAGTYVLVVDTSSSWVYGPPTTARAFRLTLTATP